MLNLKSNVSKDTWTTDEVKNLLLKLIKDTEENEDLLYHYNGDYKELKLWIKDNL